MRAAALSIVSLLIMASLGGCFGEEKEVIEEIDLFGSLCADNGGIYQQYDMGPLR